MLSTLATRQETVPVATVAGRRSPVAGGGRCLVVVRQLDRLDGIPIAVHDPAWTILSAS